MADGLNRCTMLGFLGADPELRYTQVGQAVLNCRLAVTTSFLNKDKQRQERTTWMNFTVWGKRGEALSKILNKGSQVYIEGELVVSSYDDRDGQKRWKTEINASNVILCGGGKGGGGHDAPADHDDHDDGNAEDAPRGRGGYGGSRGQGQARGGGYSRQSSRDDSEGHSAPRGGGNGGGAARAPAPKGDVEPGFGSGGDDGGYGNPDDEIPF